MTFSFFFIHATFTSLRRIFIIFNFCFKRLGSQTLVLIIYIFSYLALTNFIIFHFTFFVSLVSYYCTQTTCYSLLHISDIIWHFCTRTHFNFSIFAFSSSNSLLQLPPFSTIKFQSLLYYNIYITWLPHVVDFFWLSFRILGWTLLSISFTWMFLFLLSWLTSWLLYNFCIFYYLSSFLPFLTPFSSSSFPRKNDKVWSKLGTLSLGAYWILAQTHSKFGSCDFVKIGLRSCSKFWPSIYGQNEYNFH